MTSLEHSAPLAGLTVLEVGVFMAAPFATMQLADLGAKVIKIENPDAGDPVRSSGPFVNGESSPFARLNRNKNSIALDLKSAEGREAFLRLAASADVLVENMRPGAMTRLGLNFENLRKAAPRLVHASVSGWGAEGPLSKLAGLDIMAQARSGLMSITGEPGGDPAKIGVPICDLTCGLYVAIAVLAALRDRDNTGEGQHINVSLFETGVSFAVWEAGKYFATGEVSKRQGSAHQNSAPYQAIRTSDGWITIGAITSKTWAGMCEGLGLERLLEDERFATGYQRRSYREEVIQAIEEVSTTLTTSAILATLEERGVPCAPINSYDQVFTDVNLEAQNFYWDAAHPTMGPVRQLGSPMRFSRSHTVRAGAGPQLGNATYDVLLKAGYTVDEVDALVASGVARAQSENATAGVAPASAQ